MIKDEEEIKVNDEGKNNKIIKILTQFKDADKEVEGSKEEKRLTIIFKSGSYYLNIVLCWMKCLYFVLILENKDLKIKRHIKKKKKL